ncbi:DUF2515 family protein [Alteribacter populi]|uniref:DUF2515 family protein n=1 Tax=Alteribacter populi TaxID=2011011 RepID=UPI000BBA7132|nr:DUF2515 family protein [Alteribacter populi]
MGNRNSLLNISGNLWSWLKNEAERLKYEKLVSVDWKSLNINHDAVKKIEAALVEKQTGPSFVLSSDQQLIQSIRVKTAYNNRNNVTRTTAYLKFYLAHPEVHWAFLAHMVSRNGGWNMTDLKGNLLDGIMSPNDQKVYFSFLEKANALIFADSYPQLLLYEASKEKNKNYFSFLPKFGVSRFMKPIWDYFLKDQQVSQLLTVALIINEQHYIDKRVVQHPHYKKDVFNSWQYQAQDLFQLTQVVFPYFQKPTNIRLAGKWVKDFKSVAGRITIGKELYSILFGIPSIYEGVLRFAKEIPHTGSREDYWNHVFSSYSEKLKNNSWHSCSKNNAPPYLYSPTLEKAWEDVIHKAPANGDWYQGPGTFRFFSSINTPKSFDITSDYCRDLHHMTLFKEASLF